MEPAGPSPLLARLALIEQLIIEVLADVYTAARDPALLLSPDAFCDPGGSAPGSKAAHSGAKALASGLRVLRTSYELLSSGRTCTYREFYYLHAEFFGNQLEANAAVLAVGARLGLLRHELGFLAAPRGWFMGPIAVDVVSPGTAAGCDDSGPSAPHTSARPRSLGLDHFSQHGPRSVPPAAVSHPVRVVNHGANFILVVEKECIFRRLVEDGFWRGEGGGGLGPCLLVTGCGFPDLATRALLWHIHGALPRIPIYGLSDWNPYGMAIMMCARPSWGRVLGVQCRSPPPRPLAHFPGAIASGPRLHPRRIVSSSRSSGSASAPATSHRLASPRLRSRPSRLRTRPRRRASRATRRWPLMQASPPRRRALSWVRAVGGASRWRWRGSWGAAWGSSAGRTCRGRSGRRWRRPLGLGQGRRAARLQPLMPCSRSNEVTHLVLRRERPAGSGLAVSGPLSGTWHSLCIVPDPGLYRVLLFRWIFCD